MFTDDQGEQWLSVKEAVDYIRSKGGRATEATLNTMRSRGNGPTFRKQMGAILYRKSAIDVWMEANSSPEVKSTSELKALRRPE